jgi:hypothetical protein
MTGKRRDIEPGDLHEPGEYGKLRGIWCCCTPNGHAGNLSAHTVIEHTDGSITVTPSILVNFVNIRQASWHGYLTRGVWRSV